jgi:hypothetical protein
MTISRFVFPLLAAFLAACTTNINTTQRLEPTAVGAMKFAEVRVTASSPTISSPTMEDLKTAVETRLKALPQGNMPVTVAIEIIDMQIVSGEERAFIGVFGGDNHMAVKVKVSDPSGKTLADFQVDRNANPGGYGMFYDQKQATIEQVANGIAETLSGQAAH